MRTPAHLGGHCGITHLDEAVLEYLIVELGIRSLLDVGCGPGGMVALARSKGLRAIGIDGDPVVASGLVRLHDFTSGPAILADAPFDLAWSVEFVEHVTEGFLPHVLQTFGVCENVLLTAAPPGKPGHHHVNCQPAEYWKFALGRAGFLLDSERGSLSVSRIPLY